MLFGNAPISTTKLLRIVTSEIPARAKSEGRSDWTQAAKQVLYKLGKKRRFLPCASIHVGAGKHDEWLLDIVWYSVKGGIRLAVESEWGTLAHVLDDFEKLMCAKSPLKLMLFKSANTGHSTQEVVGQLEGYLADFRQNVQGERYLLVDFISGEHRCYELNLRRNGKQKRSEVKFSHVKSMSGPDTTGRRSPA